MSAFGPKATTQKDDPQIFKWTFRAHNLSKSSNKKRNRILKSHLIEIMSRCITSSEFDC